MLEGLGRLTKKVDQQLTYYIINTSNKPVCMFYIQQGAYIHQGPHMIN